MSIRPSSLKSNHLDVHLRTILMLSRTRWSNLSRSGLLKRCFTLKWLANNIVVKKKSGKWRVCVDFRNLNKAYPKDHFSMPRINQLVDATVGHPQMSFLMPSRRTIKYHWLWAIRRKQLLSLLLEITTTKWCPLNWRMQGLPIRGWWQGCSSHN